MDMELDELMGSQLKKEQVRLYPECDTIIVNGTWSRERKIYFSTLIEDKDKKLYKYSVITYYIIYKGIDKEGPIQELRENFLKAVKEKIEG